MLSDVDQGGPMDPTDDAQGLMGDTSGLTGITSDNNDDTTNRVGPTTLPTQGLSDPAYLDSLDKGSETEIVTQPGTNTPPQTNQDDPTGNQTLTNNPSPAVSGEQSVSGDMPDPSSDDDSLANAQAMGQQLDEDEEHPEQLDVARDEDLKEIENRQS